MNGTGCVTFTDEVLWDIRYTRRVIINFAWKCPCPIQITNLSLVACGNFMENIKTKTLISEIGEPWTEVHSEIIAEGSSSCIQIAEEALTKKRSKSKCKKALKAKLAARGKFWDPRKWKKSRYRIWSGTSSEGQPVRAKTVSTYKPIKIKEGGLKRERE